MTRRWFCFLFVVLPSLLCCAQLRAEASALEWLERMTAALESNHFEGEVVYAEGNQVQSVSVSQTQPGQEHAWPKGDPARAQQRVFGVVQDAGGDGTGVLSRPMPGTGGWSAELLHENYQLIDHGDDSRYGYQLREIELRPRDDKRYAYRVWIDQQTLMPIRWDWYGADGELTRQLKFVSLRVEEQNQSSRSVSSVPGHGDVAESARPLDLGFGFAMVPEPMEAFSMADGTRVERYLLSDGLASVSLYRGSADWATDFQGVHALGPLHLTALRQGESSLLLLGEVPAETLQHLAQEAREQL